MHRRSGRSGLLLALAVLAAALVAAWIWISTTGTPIQAVTTLDPTTKPRVESVEPAVLATPETTPRLAEELPPPATPATEPQPDPKADLARKYKGMPKDRLESALRDTVAAVDARSKQVLVLKGQRGEFEVVDKGLGGEVNVLKLHPDQPPPLAGRLQARTGSTAFKVTTVRPGDDPLLDSLLSEADWIRSELAELDD